MDTLGPKPGEAGFDYEGVEFSEAYHEGEADYGEYLQDLDDPEIKDHF